MTKKELLENEAFKALPDDSQIIFKTSEHRRMSKAILLCASIGWQTIYDEKGRPKARHIGVSVSWMPYEMSYKRCGYNHHISEEFFERMRHDPRLIEMQVDAVVRCFVNGAIKLMVQHHAELSDMSEACEELRRGLPEGFRSFLENDKTWIHHFNEVLNVPKGCRYRADDGEWYEAEEDAIIVVRYGAGDQMMTQAEYERIKQKED